MPVYAVGDLQGCYDPLRRLLDRVSFAPAHDRLWLTGDLVNRGPDSLRVLRFVRGLGDAAITVLGNHDLHLLALGLTSGRKTRSGDTLDGVLAAPDRDELLHWLRHRPLLHCDETLKFTLVHAGIAPRWDLETARARAAEVESALRGPRHEELLQGIFSDVPPAGPSSPLALQRLAYSVGVFTRMRYCTAEGQPDYADNGPPGSQGAGLMPWFRVPGRACAGERIVFGHWAALGPVSEPDVYPLDGGCVWGGHLAALRLDTSNGALTRIACPQAVPPGGADTDVAAQR